MSSPRSPRRVESLGKIEGESQIMQRAYKTNELAPQERVGVERRLGRKLQE